MIIPGILFVLGLLCLIKGGDWFVDGASALARRFHLPELLIGATVVSVGTTLPEVMVSTISAVSGHGEIAYGNAIGSVICNTALIAAITVAVRPGKVDPKPLRVPVAFFFAAAAIYCVAAYGMGRFTRPMGLLMLGACSAGLYGGECLADEKLLRQSRSMRKSRWDIGKIRPAAGGGRSPHRAGREPAGGQRHHHRAGDGRTGIGHRADLRGAGYLAA